MNAFSFWNHSVLGIYSCRSLAREVSYVFQTCEGLEGGTVMATSKVGSEELTTNKRVGSGRNHQRAHVS